MADFLYLQGKLEPLALKNIKSFYIIENILPCSERKFAKRLPEQRVTSMFANTYNNKYFIDLEKRMKFGK